MKIVKSLIVVLFISIFTSLGSAQVSISGSTIIAGSTASQQFFGTWSSSETYGLNAIVIQGQAAYISLISNNLNNTPSSSPSQWGALPSGSVQPSSTINLLSYYPSIGSSVGPDTSLSDNLTSLIYTGSGGFSAPYLKVTGAQSGTALGLQLATSYGIAEGSGALEFFLGTSTFPTYYFFSTGVRSISTGYYCWSSSSTNGAGCDTALFRASAGTVEISNSSTAGVGGALSAPTGNAEVVAFSATPTFSTSYSVSRIVLTANITSFTLGSGIVDGQGKTLCFQQGSSSLYTVTPPANVHGFPNSASWTSNSAWNCALFNWDKTDSIWLNPTAINQ
jgi:hypothetical protein